MRYKFNNEEGKEMLRTILTAIEASYGSLHGDFWALPALRRQMIWKGG